MESRESEGDETELDEDGRRQRGEGDSGEESRSKESDVDAEEPDGDPTSTTNHPEPTPLDTPARATSPDLESLEAGETRKGAGGGKTAGGEEPREDVPEEVRKYDRFKKVDRAEYDRVNDFIRKRTYITAREWAIARLCSDFRTETGVEMTLIGENLPRLVPFMEDTYTPQAVNQARSAFEDKVKMAGSTFLYGAMSGFFTTEELDEMMYEVSETARFLLEVEGVEIGVEHETEVQDRISDAMRDIRESSRELRGEEDDETHRCPECGNEF